MAGPRASAREVGFSVKRAPAVARADVRRASAPPGMRLATLGSMTVPTSAFSLTRGGPFHTVIGRRPFHDANGRPRWSMIALAAWLPFAAATLVDALFGEHSQLWRDFTVHVRLLVAIPLLILAERVVDARATETVRVLRLERIVEPEKLERFVTHALKMRDAWYVEVALAAIALVGGVYTVWMRGESGPLALPRHPYGLSLANLWYGVISLPLLQFLGARWLWRWSIWSYVLIRLSRLPLAVNAVHPDRAGGLKILAAPIDGFALFAAAQACLLSAATIVRVVEHGAKLQTYIPVFGAFLVGAIIVGCGPLLAFSGQLYRARCRDVVAYHAVAHDLVRAFRRKWMAKPASHPEPQIGMLEENAFSALIDMDSSFEVTQSTRTWLLCKGPVRSVLLGVVTPMLPAVLAAVPLVELVRKLGPMLLGLG